MRKRNKNTIGKWGGTEVIKSLGHEWAFSSSAVVINLSGMSTNVFWCLLNSCTSIVFLYIVAEGLENMTSLEHYMYRSLITYLTDHIPVCQQESISFGFAPRSELQYFLISFFSLLQICGKNAIYKIIFRIMIFIFPLEMRKKMYMYPLPNTALTCP